MVEEAVFKAPLRFDKTTQTVVDAAGALVLDCKKLPFTHVNLGDLAQTYVGATLVSMSNTPAEHLLDFRSPRKIHKTTHDEELE